MGRISEEGQFEKWLEENDPHQYVLYKEYKFKTVDIKNKKEYIQKDDSQLISVANKAEDQPVNIDKIDTNSLLKRPTFYDTLNLEEEEKDEGLSLIN